MHASTFKIVKDYKCYDVSVGCTNMLKLQPGNIDVCKLIIYGIEKKNTCIYFSEEMIVISILYLLYLIIVYYTDYFSHKSLSEASV